MQGKDYYAILQVHPEAEVIVIEAAYRRLAREYHPDVNKAPNAHERMVLINEAFEVLSAPETRRAYDWDRAGASSASSTAPRTERAPSAPKTERRYKEPEIAPPIPPRSADFGIADDYFDRALEGAHAWEKRPPALPLSVVTSIRVSAWATGFALLGFGSVLTAPLNFVPMWLWLAIPLAAESFLKSISAKHDARLRKDLFDPQYNPDPESYAQYALELARYEQEFTAVYVTRSGYRFHRYRYCGNMISSFEVPLYVATAKGYTACSRCGHLPLRPRLLPSPFGAGAAPPPKEEVESTEKKHTKKISLLMLVACVLPCLLVGSIIIWRANCDKQQVVSTPPTTMLHLPASTEPEVEDFSKLTPEQIENLKAERDFTPDEQPTNASEVAEPDTSHINEETTNGLPIKSVDPENVFTEFVPTKSPKVHGKSVQALSESLDQDARHSVAQRLLDLGYLKDVQSLTLSEMLHIESKLGTAKRLKEMGYEADWERQTLSKMLDIESRIGASKRLKDKGIVADWRNHSLSDLLRLEGGM
jgi:curved DNA-binding protein CbpA